MACFNGPLFIADLSTGKSGVHLRAVHDTIKVDKLQLGQVSLPVLQVSPVSIIPPLPHIHSFICTLLSYKGQTIEA